MPHFSLHAACCQCATFAAWLWVVVHCSPVGAATPPSTFDFNGPGTSWQIPEDRRVARILLHECSPGGARDNAGFERMIVAAPGGHSVSIVCPTAPVVVLNELEVRIWVKASRPDVQLAAGITLPRAIDEDSGAAARVIVRGASHQRAGHWQQLVLNDVPKKLANQVRILRSTSNTKIDPREAVVDAVVLIIPGEPQGVEVATDDLVVDGVVRAESDDIRLTSYPVAPGGPAPGVTSTRTVPANLRHLPDLTSATTTASEKASVRLSGDLLLVSEMPFFPRAVQYQGEPLAFLAERGFNVVWLSRTPTVEEAALAKKHDLWFMSVPPHPETLARDGLGEQADRVVAWFLDDNALEDDPNYAQRWADLVRRSDAVAGRPVVVAPVDDWTSASKAADVLLAERARLSHIPISEYDVWLSGRSSLVRPGTPLWACLPSQSGPAAARQIAALSGGPIAAYPNLPEVQLHSLAAVAGSRGIRGLALRSDTSLSDADAATRARATNLELINRRLQRLEPWLASGKAIGRYSSTDATWSSIVLHLDRAQLLIPVADSGMSTPRPAVSRDEVAFVVPGIAESCQVYLFTPVALKALPAQRVAGGTRVVVTPEADAFVLMTEDPRVVHSLRQHIARYGNRVVQLQRESAALKAAAIAETSRRLTQSGVRNSGGQAAASIGATLRQINAPLASHRVEEAYQASVAAKRMLDQLAAEMRRLVNAPTTPYSNPLALGDDTLAELAAFERARPTLQYGENLLYGGDFEDLGVLTQIGWRHFQSQAPGVEAQAELSVAEPRHGTHCLMLGAVASAETHPDPDSTSVWIESPPVPLTAGQVVEIAGWVRVDAQENDNGGRLQIVDSVGGPDLALVIRQTNGWERFHIVRAIPESTELRLTFALSGLGTVQLDAVMVRPFEPPSNQRGQEGPTFPGAEAAAQAKNFREVR